MFIVLEGLDGSGSTTQLRMLAEALRAPEITPEIAPEIAPPEIVCTAEPTSGPVGRLIREALAGRLLGEGVLPYLFTADRRDHLDRLVLPALRRGAIVLSDRYLLSSLAYQSAALPMERVAELNADFRAPDLTILMDLPVDACLARIEARAQAQNVQREIFERRERLLLIADAYDRAAKLRLAAGDRLIRLDASGSREEVHARILSAVRAILPRGTP